jgi:hypothetical protein
MPITGIIPQAKSGIDAFLDQMNQSYKNRFIQAQTQREQAKANLPFGGEIPPGPAGQTVGLEMVKQLYGENSTQYQQAKASYDLNQKGIESRVNYQKVLTDSANKRFSTPLAKTVQEFEDIKNGYLPGTKIPMTDEQKNNYFGMYGLDLVKRTSDLDTRKKNLYSHNMDITLSQIDPRALTNYSGIAGGMKLLADKRDSLMGKSVPAYEAYERSMTAAKTLAKQVRQFYGDSITSGVQEGLKELTNPTSWLKNPNVALQKYNQFIKLLTSESKTYQQATQSPAIYSGQKGIGSNASPENASAPIPQNGAPQSIPNNLYNSQILANQSATQNEGIANIPALQENNPIGVPPGKMAIIDSNGEEHIIDEDKFEQAKLIDPGVRKKEANNATA